MTDKIIIHGKIVFDPEEKTTKHKEQGAWKKIAIIEIDGQVSEYYSWFIKKRYNLILNKPLRGSHITFINDSHKDLGVNGLANWEVVKRKWNGKQISVTLCVDPRTDDEHWWLNIPQEDRETIHSIRAELGLGRPFWGLHLTIGYANEKNIEHSRYIHRLIKNNLINY